MAEPFIMVAPTGARLGKADHPALPVSVDEITETAIACKAAGAHGLHLHIRDAEGAHSLDPGRYREAIAAINAQAPRLKLQITTEAADRFEVADQLRCIEALRPEWASVSIREMARDPAVAARLYACAAEASTCVQHILYDAADARLLTVWRRDGIVKDTQTDVILVLGRYAGGPPSRPDHIAPLLGQCTGINRWMVCAFGPAEHGCLAEAARLGGDLRVGFENACHGPDGTIWRNNAASVAALVRATLPLSLVES
ncbi:3-keto-5-aminohexanoate cleavage protein [Gymnodinialimonas ulvae]|uniref:3-keto-5-aminohexanoate cleavage protein n=1 Tax=Gymnodinialimonas ulvae TaxID=3126504 RepID=UPI00309ED307